MTARRRLRRGLPVVLACGLLLGVASAGTAETGPQGTTANLRTVRIDLQAGAFLDPLPHDQPFLIVGRAPASTRIVEARIDEYLEEPISPTEAELGRFEARLRDELAAAGGVSTGLTESQIRRARELLLAEVRDAGSRGMLGKLWHYGAPWNWDNWGEISQARQRELVAPGTIWEDAGASADLEAGATPTAMARQLAQRARAARVGTYAPSRALRPLVRWRRLGEGPGEAEAVTDVGGGLNQLVRIHALASTSDDDPFSAVAQAQRGGADRGGRSFRLLIDPLDGQRHYVFRFRIERDPSEAEVEAFLGRALRRGDAAVARAGRGTLSASERERLRGVLVESLRASTGGAAVAGGGLLDVSTADGEVREQLLDLVQQWQEIDESLDDEVSSTPLAAELRDLAREQRLVETTSAEAPTMGDDYVSADVGLVYAPTIGKTAATIGANFYLRPVDKSAPLTRTNVWQRLAFTAGLTLNSIEDRRGIRSDLYYHQALVLGAGYRISQYWRLGVGGLVFRERDPDSYPLTRRRSTAVTPYVALTADLDAGRQLKGVGGLLDFLKGGQ